MGWDAQRAVSAFAEWMRNGERSVSSRRPASEDLCRAVRSDLEQDPYPKSRLGSSQTRMGCRDGSYKASSTRKKPRWEGCPREAGSERARQGRAKPGVYTHGPRRNNSELAGEDGGLGPRTPEGHSDRPGFAAPLPATPRRARYLRAPGRPAHRGSRLPPCRPGPQPPP